MTCTCTTSCDCQDEPNGLVSNECPEHNHYPQPSPYCPVHGMKAPSWSCPSCGKSECDGYCTVDRWDGDERDRGIR